MKWGISILLMVTMLSSFTLARQTKVINKNFRHEANKTIEFEDFRSLNVKISTWDKDEIGINLKAYVDCSDDEYEQLYINSLDITNNVIGSRQVISLEKTSEQGGFSFLGLFKIRLGFYFSVEMTGEIFLPDKISAILNFDYSDILLKSINGIKEINGRSNGLNLFDCSGLIKISNDYGKLNLEKCKGDISISSRSTTIKINDHQGDLLIDADYSDIKISNTEGFISLSDRSGDIEIKNSLVRELHIPYSDLEIRDMNFKSDNRLVIKGRSSTLSFYNVKSNLDIESDYTNASFRNTTGDIIFDGKSCDLKGEEVNGNLEISSTYSEFEFHFLKANEIKISNSNNSIELDLVSEPQKVNITNKYGNVEISLPKNYDGEIDLETRYGKINSDFDLEYDEHKTKKSGYSKGKSMSQRIKIENSNGDIILKK